MSKYSEEHLVLKLGKLVDTQDSITLLTQWLMYHRKHARTSVHVWARELQKASTSKKLAFIHLCNDVLQNSRKKGEDFVKAFEEVLPESINSVYRHSVPAIQAKVIRILNIWEERHVYTNHFINKIRDRIGVKQQGPPPALPGSAAPHHHAQHHAVPFEKQQELVQSIPSRFSTVQKAHESRLKLETLTAGIPPSADHLSENTVSLLTTFKDSLSVEMEERKRFANDLRALLETQEYHISTCSAALKETTKRLEKSASPNQSEEYSPTQPIFSSALPLPPGSTAHIAAPAGADSSSLNNLSAVFEAAGVTFPNQNGSFGAPS
ncbi:Regulation of nuclear pre-mRNA domain containing protein 1B [Chytridiales sp. JEL 0842]|nr:Regulation of nuclear pre-mRNA domain containing protein 1B [Chytridiales sp. JEL 0842]